MAFDHVTDEHFLNKKLGMKIVIIITEKFLVGKRKNLAMPKFGLKTYQKSVINDIPFYAMIGKPDESDPDPQTDQGLKICRRSSVGRATDL